LQVCREAFCCFVEEFRTYGSILSTIKTEYEATFLSQRATIEKLIPFKSKLSILEYESGQKYGKQVNESSNIEKRLKIRIAELEEMTETLDTALTKEKEINIDLAEEVLKFESANVREEFLNQKIKEMRSTHQREDELKQDEVDELKYENSLLTEELDESKLKTEVLEIRCSQLTEDSKSMVDGVLLANSQKAQENISTNLSRYLHALNIQERPPKE
jgi:hypothetical protein